MRSSRLKDAIHNKGDPNTILRHLPSYYCIYKLGPFFTLHWNTISCTKEEKMFSSQEGEKVYF